MTGSNSLATRIWHRLFGGSQEKIKEAKKRPTPTPEALSSAEAEERRFMTAFMLSSADPFRGIVHVGWVRLQELVDNQAPQEEIEEARATLEYYWRQWKENASIQIEKGRALYYAEPNAAQTGPANSEAPTSEHTTEMPFGGIHAPSPSPSGN